MGGKEQAGGVERAPLGNGNQRDADTGCRRQHIASWTRRPNAICRRLRGSSCIRRFRLGAPASPSLRRQTDIPLEVSTPDVSPRTFLGLVVVNYLCALAQLTRCQHRNHTIFDQHVCIMTMKESEMSGCPRNGRGKRPARKRSEEKRPREYVQGEMSYIRFDHGGITRFLSTSWSFNAAAAADATGIITTL